MACIYPGKCGIAGARFSILISGPETTIRLLMHSLSYPFLPTNQDIGNGYINAQIWVLLHTRRYSVKAMYISVDSASTIQTSFKTEHPELKVFQKQAEKILTNQLISESSQGSLIVRAPEALIEKK